MFIKRNSKTIGRKKYTSTLLVQGIRTGKKVRHKTIANLTSWPAHIVSSIEASIKGKKLCSIEDVAFKSGKNYGGLFTLHEIAKKLSIKKVLGKSQFARLALILVFGRILTQGSRRHLTFWKNGEAIEEALDIKTFSTDDLYRTLDWLEKKQQKFEKQLFKERYGSKKIRLFLYDVTSSYPEGQNNELAAYGYNRDGKKGKKQIVIGLLTDEEGYPVAVEVFKGNTTDSATVSSQIKKLANRFNVKDVVFVGDRGMIKKTGIKIIEEENNWKYITAITKPQIEKLLKKNVFQMEFFDEELCEVQHEKKRYILRRNPYRTKEVSVNRKERIKKVFAYTKKLNEYLCEHQRAKGNIALNNLQKKITQCKLDKILKPELEDRKLLLVEDKEGLLESAKFDGCYVIKTNIAKEDMAKEEIHKTYKNLKFVEWTFRTMKTSLLEIRPIFHRKANRTRALAFVAMLSYMIVYYIWQKCNKLEVPLEEIIAAIEQIQTTEIQMGEHWISTLPKELRKDQQLYLNTLGIIFPKSLNCSSVDPKK